jgi:ethanolamine utilization protein EutN
VGVGPRADPIKQTMQLGRVVGTVVVNNKNETLAGVTLLLVQPMSSTREAVGRVIVAADSMGAGVGEDVFFVRGKEASFPFYPTEVPADAGIVGIVDSWHIG